MSATILCPVPSEHALQGPSVTTPAAVRLTRRSNLENGNEVESLEFTHLKRVSGLKLNPEAPFEICLMELAVLTDEEYILEVSQSGAKIHSSTEQGAQRGLATFAQLCMQDALREGRIQDKPTLRTRGYMLDISRDRVPTRSTLLHVLDMLWLLKFNEFQLYMEHTFEFEGHERVWGLASPLTKDDVQWVQNECELRGIELVPSFNSLGHLERWLRHPEYQHLAECPQGMTLPNGRVLPCGTTLKPGPEAIEFLKPLYGELLPQFKSPWFNAGMDEPWELGLGRSQQRSKAVGGKRKLYLQHLRKVAALAAEHGKRLQFWADIVLQQPELVPELPKDAIGLIWGYEAEHPFEEQCAHFAASGMPFIVAPGTAAWNSIGGRWPTADKNLRSGIAAAIRHGAEGILLADWGDNGHHQPPSVSLPPMALAASLAWSGEAPEDIEAVLDILLLGDPKRIAGKALLALGSAWEVLPPRMHNNSLIFKWFFATNTELPSLLVDVTSDQVREVQTQLSKLQAEIERSDPRGFGGDLVKRELLLIRSMLDNACCRALAALGEPMTGLDANRCRAITCRIAGEFEALWLLRSRPGGLYESSAHIRRLFGDSLRTPQIV